MFPSASDNPYIVHVHAESNEMTVRRNTCFRRRMLLPNSANDLTIIPSGVKGNIECVGNNI